MSVQNELLSVYNPKHLAHYAHVIEELRELAASWERVPPVVELGSHRAAFLVGQARLHAPEPVLGIEWRGKYHRLALKRVGHQDLDNILTLHADAKLAVPILFPLESVDAFFVTFPDPWWKDRHAARRLLDPIFMRILARRLKPGGRLYLKSDVFDYLHRVRAFAEASGAFRPLPAERWPDESVWTLTTRERKCRNDAIPYGHGYYERRADFDAALPEAPEDPRDFSVDEVEDVNTIIRGVPPADKKARARRAAAGKSSQD